MQTQTPYHPRTNTPLAGGPWLPTAMQPSEEEQGTYTVHHGLIFVAGQDREGQPRGYVGPDTNTNVNLLSDGFFARE
jgi:hypothetical protein